MPKFCFKHLFILLLISNHLHIEAQSETNHWYFGTYAGVNFSSGEPEVQTLGQINSWEGISTISSSTGDLLFCSDGIYVFNKNHELMPNGSGLHGDPSSTQSALIVPLPEDFYVFYVFTMDDIDEAGGVNGLKYSKVDMSLNNGFGDVVTNEKNVTLELKMCEKLTAVKHENGIDIWIITQKWGTNKFYSYLLTNDGVQETPVVSSPGIVIGGDGVDIDVAKGYMKVSPDGTKLAKANAGLKSIEIFDFNDSTGIVSTGIIDTYLGCEPYGLEFSPNSHLLYINSWKSNPSQIVYQYDLQADDIIESRVQIASGSNGALQLAPDNRIYVAMAQSSFLSRINQPNNKGSSSDFEYNAVDLEGRQCMWGLPNFMSFEPDTIVNVKPTKELNTEVLSIYPNPVSEKLMIEVFGSGTKEILFYNERSILVEVVLVKAGEQNSIDATNWQRGLYIASLKEQGKVVSRKKFIVQ